MITKETIRIRKIIVHILDATVGLPVLSDTELEFGSDFSDFVKEHIARLTTGDDTKKCEFYQNPKSNRRFRTPIVRLFKFKYSESHRIFTFFLFRSLVLYLRMRAARVIKLYVISYGLVQVGFSSVFRPIKFFSFHRSKERFDDRIVIWNIRS